ncbi:MAG: serine hydrolase domain-containing protein [Brevundimonas sp.]|uniref:serine hydrolase domain-containing protein n=1 Tax=Brevundimonas sp. TaxID=1871086 RepID=UPI00391BF317
MIDRRTLMISGAAFAGLAAGPARASDALDPVVLRLREFVEQGALPFASLRVAQRGRVLVEAHIPGVETIGPQSIYRIYSMTKPVVAAGAVLLMEDGDLRLDTPVAGIVPEFADLQVLGEGDARVPARVMTVGHLLTHTCGLANSWGDARVAPLYRQAGLTAAAWMYDPEIGGLAGFARRLGELPLDHQPGADWLYGYGLDIAGLVIERINGERLGDFLKHRIFDPLGMADTGFYMPEDRADRLAGLYTAGEDGLTRVASGAELNPLRRPLADSGSGALVSTLSDYGRFADMLANGGALDGARIMSAESARLMMTPWGPQDHIESRLRQFYGGRLEGRMGQALGGVTRLDDGSGPGSTGEYAWGGAAGTGFWATPGLGLSVTMMTQVMPAGAAPSRDALRPLIYEALAGV